MTVECSGCGGETRPKQIQTKRGPTTVYECVGSCKNDKGYRLGTFAPRAPKEAGPTSNEALEVLKDIRNLLRNIHSKINAETTLKDDPLEMDAF